MEHDPFKTLKVTGRVTFRNIGAMEIGAGVAGGVITLVFCGPLGVAAQYTLAVINVGVFIVVGVMLRRALPGPSGAYLMEWMMSHRLYRPAPDPVHAPQIVEESQLQQVREETCVRRFS